MQRIVAITAMSVLTLVAACSSSALSSSSGPAASPSTSAGTPSSGQLKLAGTITESANSTTIALTYKVGPIQYTPPPRAVLSACNIVDPASISEIASSPGQVTIGYNQGSLVQPIIIQTSSLISGGNWQGVVAFDISGHWECQQDGGPINMDVPPNSDDTYPIWIMSQVLSNASPRVPTSMADAWQFTYNSISMTGALYPNVTTSGPNAANCGGMDILMVYAHLPFTVTDPNSGNTDTCKPV